MIFFRFSSKYDLCKGWYTYDVYENYPIFRQNSSTFLTLDVQFQTNPPPLFPNDNQPIKKSIIQGWLLYVIRSFLQVGFHFSNSSLILSGFTLTSFHLPEASLSAFSWLYTLVCAVVQKYHKMSFIYNYSHF